MGFLDKLKGSAGDLKKKATELATEHEQQIDSAVDKAAGLASKATKGKYDEKIDTAAEKAKEAVDGLGDEPKA